MTTSNEHNNAPAVPQDNDPAWTLAAKVREALDRKACPDYYMDVAVEAVVHNYIYATSAPAPSGFAKALDIRISHGWKLTGNTIPVLYTDTINGDQVMRDDVWLCTTSALEVEAPAPVQEAMQSFTVPDDLPGMWEHSDLTGGETDCAKPAQEVGLTDEEIDRVVLEAVGFEGYGCQAMNKADMRWVSRAIIAALRAKGGK